MRSVDSSNVYKRLYRLLGRRGWDLSLLDPLIVKLASDADPRTLFKDHPLKGRFKGLRDCHVTSVNDDWVLVYEKIGNDRLFLHATGTHRDCGLENG